jgi:hypothetical protein
VNFLDTAASYGDGEAERRIGEVCGSSGGCRQDTCSLRRLTATSRPGLQRGADAPLRREEP